MRIMSRLTASLIMACGLVINGLGVVCPVAIAGTPPVETMAGLGLGMGYDDGYVEGPYTIGLMPSLRLSTTNDEYRRFNADIGYNGRLWAFQSKLAGAMDHRFSGRVRYLMARTRSISSEFHLHATDSTTIPDIGEGARAAGPRTAASVVVGPTFSLDRRTDLSARYDMQVRTAERPRPLSTQTHGLVLSGERAANSQGTILGSSSHRFFLQANGSYATSHNIFVGYRQFLKRSIVGEVLAGPLLLVPVGEGRRPRLGEPAWSWGGAVRVVHTGRRVATGFYLERAVEPYPLETDILWSESAAARASFSAMESLRFNLTAGAYRSGLAPGGDTQFLGGWGNVEALMALSDQIDVGLDLTHFSQRDYEDAFDLTINRNVFLLKLVGGLPSMEAVHGR